MKKLITLFILVLCCVCSSNVFAQDDIKLNIDNRTIESDVAPQIIDGRTMVPVRAIFEGVGAEVEWNGETKTITGKKNDVTVVMTIDSNIASVNGLNITMDCEPVIIDGRTLAPARYVAESFGCQVDWDSDSRTVSITTPIINEETTEVTTVEITTETATETTTFETTTNPMYNYDTYYKAGTYVVGTDIPAGEYVVFANPGSIGYVYKYAKDGNVKATTGKRYIYSRYFDYCDILRLDSGNYVDLSNAYAVPSTDAEIDSSQSNGTFRAGTDIKTGHLTFKLSPESAIGYVDVGMFDASTSNREIVYLTPDNDSVIINVTTGMYVRIFGCDVLNETLNTIHTYKPVTENDNHTDSKLNFDEITPSVKSEIDTYLTTLVNDLNAKTLKSTKYTQAYYNKIVSDWSSMAKNSADRKYIEIGKSVYNNIWHYAYNTKGDVAYSAVIKMNGKEISGKTYRDIMEAEKKYITNSVNNFKNGTSFMDIELANKNLTNFRYDVPRLQGTKVS